MHTTYNAARLIQSLKKMKLLLQLLKQNCPKTPETDNRVKLMVSE